MFCSNCGKQIKDDDNFCRYCGNDLREKNQNVESYIEEAVEEQINETPEKIIVELKKKDSVYEGEELVLYEIQKHWMSLFWPVFLTPIFLVYFWIYFLNSHSFFSWLVVISFLALIIYPIARYKSDSIVITTKAAHIKIGILKPSEIEIPLEKLNIIDVSQSSLGRYFDYGTATFCMNSEKYDYPYIKYPEDLQFIIDQPQKFIQETLQT